ncbi:uncharacterized protein LOC100893710 [Strongylocentrotus purpuratus]|uniref:Death domain-containing protein n=1 Tax=Strongylocentrotus purpuratus TaxID=7668 RepID=A0A7M7N2L4_STRPU|nr:uncharacterized protein LOC100893710 [Strongylocentrotus purpuratus]
MVTVDKDALFDELSKNFPAANYSAFCNKIGVGYNEAKSMLTRCKEDYNVALRDLLAQWDQRMKNATREQLEDALVGADVGGLCSIVRKHYAKASTEVVAARVAATGVVSGDGSVHNAGNRVINQSDRSDSVHTDQGGNIHSQQYLSNHFCFHLCHRFCFISRNTSAASKEDTGDIVQRGEQVRNQAEQAPTVRKRVSNSTSAAAVGDDEDDTIAYNRGGGDNSKRETQQVPAVKQRGDDLDPTSNIKMERITETKDGNRSTTTFIWTGISKEQIIYLGIFACVGVGLFFLNRRKN